MTRVSSRLNRRPLSVRSVLYSAVMEGNLEKLLCAYDQVSARCMIRCQKPGGIIHNWQWCSPHYVAHKMHLQVIMQYLLWPTMQKCNHFSRFPSAAAKYGTDRLQSTHARHSISLSAIEKMANAHASTHTGSLCRHTRKVTGCDNSEWQSEWDSVKTGLLPVAYRGQTKDISNPAWPVIWSWQCYRHIQVENKIVKLPIQLISSN